jgi:hypothetical protein
MRYCKKERKRARKMARNQKRKANYRMSVQKFPSDKIILNYLN